MKQSGYHGLITIVPGAGAEVGGASQRMTGKITNAQ